MNDIIKQRLYIDSPDDRTALVAILAKNGYTVRIGKEKEKDKNRVKIFVEYWRE